MSSKYIILTNGGETIVDADMFVYLSQWRWWKNQGYVLRTIADEKGFPQTIRMHRLIMHAPKKFVVDHINRNTLDNRRENLRIIPASINTHASVKKEKKNPYRGVCWVERDKKWVVQIAGKYVGMFTSAEAAAHAYDEKAKELYKEYAVLNFP